MNWNIVKGIWMQHKGKIAKASHKDDYIMQEGILSRREVLRGALAVGCSLLAPALFSAPAHSATSAAPPTTIKRVSPASVKYQTHPKGEQKCSKCVNFIAESNTCKVVEGKVSPDGWCVMWVKKA